MCEVLKEGYVWLTKGCATAFDPKTRAFLTFHALICYFTYTSHKLRKITLSRLKFHYLLETEARLLNRIKF